MNHSIVKFLNVTLCCLLAVTTFCTGQGEHVPLLSELDYGEAHLSHYENYGYEDIEEPVTNHTDLEIDMIGQNVDHVSEALMTPVARSLQDFSFDIFNAAHRTAREEGNVVMSPLSIYTALAMLRPGLTGDSLSQINDVMGVNGLTNDDVGELFDVIYRENPRYKLRYANRVYVDKSVRLQKAYKNEIERLHVVQARRTDFFRDPSGSRNKMNRYVRNRTRRLIDELIPEDAVSADTRLFLINALYLKASWNFVFVEGMTQMRHFRLDGRKSIQVPTMQTKNAICTVHRDDVMQADVTVLTLGESLSMIIMMPLYPGNFTGFYDNDREQMKSKFGRMFDAIWPAEDNGERVLDVCSLMLPKFSVEYETDLMTSLRFLGLNDVFDATTSDLSRMTQRNVGNLYVSDVRHKAVIVANEGGIEAAAATSMGMEIRSSGKTNVHVDRPFMFAVRQDETGAILFLGKVVRPVAA